MDYTLKEIDDRLWHRFKIMAATQQKTMKQIIVDMITDAVNQFEVDQTTGKEEK